VACTDRRTLYHLDPRRGQAAMDAAGVLPAFTGIAVHDGYASYRRYTLSGVPQMMEPAGRRLGGLSCGDGLQPGDRACH
jgi:transposase IS66 family protein